MPRKPGIRNSGKRFSEEEKVEAIAAYIAKGTYEGAADMLKINSSTIRSWRDNNPDWWDTKAQEILDFDREARMARFAEIVDGGTKEILDRIQNGDSRFDSKSGEIHKVPVSCRDLVIATGTALDKHRLLAGQPTSISGKAVSGDSILEALKQAASKPVSVKNPTEH